MTPIYQVDAFTDSAFSGNPAGVCLLEKSADADWMQNVAAEMNLSETAFLVRSSENEFHLRWFTPTVEVDLCGHATLASAHILYGAAVRGVVAEQPIRFTTRSGELSARREADSGITLNFPATAPVSTEPSKAFEDVFGRKPVWIGKTRFDLFAEFDSEETVREIDPNPAGVASLGARGVVVSARAKNGSEFDFVSRYFAPACGIPEDPVTGSAHCALAPYWAEKLGRSDLAGYQASRRGGIVRVNVFGDRVELVGHAVTVFSGTLHV
ncbi:MAG: PhzF family phenazine biosynthesis protein [Rubricoccaceae bacterium]|nr:PhzF family phenazine biosynthesis protein [Rubricoccaceae bacterium]